MSKRYICDKDTGRMLYYGTGKQSLVDAGHTVVPSDNVRPDETHVWMGDRWAKDLRLQDEIDNLEAKRKRQREYPPIQDQLKALFEGGPAMVGMKAKLDQVDANNPIT